MNYKVYQGDELKQTVTSKTAVMNGLQPNKTYDFSVQPDNGQTGSVGANLIVQSDFNYGYLGGDGSVNPTNIDFYSENYIATNGETVFTFSSPDYVFKGSFDDRIIMYDINKNYLGCQSLTSPTQTLNQSNVAYIRFCINSADEGNTTGYASDWLANHRYKLEKGSVATTYVATTSVTTRGIRFNIPKTLTVGSNITLRYEEYPLGIVPIGNEPDGYFGGGNKQSLSAKVISTANGSSVVEVAGNVIDVGGVNLYSGTDKEYTMGFGIPNTTWKDGYAYEKLPTTDIYGEILPQVDSHYYTLTQGVTYTQTIWFETDATVKDLSATQITWFTNVGGHDVQPARVQKLGQNSYKVVSTYTWPGKTDNHVRLFDIVNLSSGFDLSTGTYLKFGKLKLEPGTIATPYASFVDGDTFTAQPDGTFALFSEHKALYY